MARILPVLVAFALGTLVGVQFADSPDTSHYPLVNKQDDRQSSDLKNYRKGNSSPDVESRKQSAVKAGDRSEESTGKEVSVGNKVDTFTIRGKVIDQYSKPLNGVSVTLKPTTDMLEFGSARRSNLKNSGQLAETIEDQIGRFQRFVKYTKTDDKGEFEFELENVKLDFVVFADLEGYEGDSLVVYKKSHAGHYGLDRWSKKNVYELQLKRQHLIKLKVLLPDGSAPPKARIRSGSLSYLKDVLNNGYELGKSEESLGYQYGDDSNWNRDTGTVMLDRDDEGFIVFTDGYVSDVYSFSSDTIGHQEEIEVKLLRSTLIHGTVTYPEELQNVKLEVGSRSLFVYPGDRYRFSNLIPGEIEIELKEDYITIGSKTVTLKKGEHLKLDISPNFMEKDLGLIIDCKGINGVKSDSFSIYKVNEGVAMHSRCVALDQGEGLWKIVDSGAYYGEEDDLDTYYMVVAVSGQPDGYFELKRGIKNYRYELPEQASLDIKLNDVKVKNSRNYKVILTRFLKDKIELRNYGSEYAGVGKFKFSLLAPGNYQLKVLNNSIEMLSKEITISKGNNEFNSTLEHLHPVAVTIDKIFEEDGEYKTIQYWNLSNLKDIHGGISLEVDDEGVVTNLMGLPEGEYMIYGFDDYQSNPLARMYFKIPSKKLIHFKKQKIDSLYIYDTNDGDIYENNDIKVGDRIIAVEGDVFNSIDAYHNLVTMHTLRAIKEDSKFIILTAIRGTKIFSIQVPVDDSDNENALDDLEYLPLPRDFKPEGPIKGY